MPVAKPSVAELLSALKRERSTVETLRHDLAATRRELEASRRETQTERELGATLTKELSAALADLKAMSVELDQAANTMVQARQATDAVAKANEKAAHERARSAALEQKLLVARKDIAAIKDGAQAANGAREEILRRDLAAARRDLDAMRRAGDDAAQARNVADTVAEKERALEQQRERAEGLARDLTAVRREMEDLRAKAADTIRSKAAALRAQQAGEVALADAKRALDEERNKLGAYERELAAARQSVAALEARASLAAAEQAAAVDARKLAETTASRAGEVLSSESEKGRSLARDLDAALRERAEARQALDEERQKLAAYERDLAAVRQSVAALEARANLAEAEQVAAVKARKLAEGAASRAGEALSLESEKGRSLARDLDAARRELADAKRTLDEERQKRAAFERDLAAARQSVAALKARADLAAGEQAAAMEARKLAEVAAARAGEALALESEKGKSLARDLDAARRERDTAKEELTRVLAAQRTALEQRERANSRDLARRQKNDDLKARSERRVADNEPLSKARLGNRANERAKAVQPTAARSARDQGSKKIRRVQVRNPTRAVRPATIALPDALLPEHLPVSGLW
nr:hypothetical protein [Sinorhizobium terangae]